MSTSLTSVQIPSELSGAVFQEKQSWSFCWDSFNLHRDTPPPPDDATVSQLASLPSRALLSVCYVCQGELILSKSFGSRMTAELLRISD